jgi:tRNA dimethylallyltransferase
VQFATTAAPVALIGPTASGKSALAMALARHQPGWEIVSVDSMQCYRRLDIGTAKPTLQQRRDVPHHLLDVIEPSDEWSVAEFQRGLQTVLRDIASRHHRALCVGGTGLHLRAVVDGLDLPGRWPQHRRDLERRAEVEGPQVLFEELRRVDPVAAAKIEPHNSRRLVRALEVTLGSGRPFSSFGTGLDAYRPSPVVQVGLRWDRTLLEARITQRVHDMIATGWCREVMDLMNEPSPLSRTAAVAVGYRELADHLRGACSLDEAIAAIIIRTRQLAARQMRWFRRDPRIRWIDIDHDPVAEALPRLLEWVNP